MAVLSASSPAATPPLRPFVVAGCGVAGGGGAAAGWAVGDVSSELRAPVSDETGREGAFASFAAVGGVVGAAGGANAT